MNEKMPLEKAVFSDAWNLLAEAYTMQNVPANWELLVNRGESICEKYQNTAAGKLAVEITSAVVSHITTVKEAERKGGVAHA